jgi:hypothetical protein
MKYVVSVAKAYKHRGRHRHFRAKKHWFVYYYDELGKFHTQRVDLLQALYYKIQKRHRYKITCTQCGSVFIALIKSFRDKLECPYCNS